MKKGATRPKVTRLQPPAKRSYFQVLSNAAPRERVLKEFQPHWMAANPPEIERRIS